MEKGKELIEKLEEKFIKIEKQKMPKDVRKNILKKILLTLSKGSVIVAILIIINIAYSTMIVDRLENDIKIFSGFFLGLGIIYLEIAYRKDSGTKTISALEFIVLSIYLLSTTYLLQRYKFDTNILYIISSAVIGIYYIIKSICIYIKLKKEYIKTLSDISEIVKKDEPTIKEAKKREKNIVSKNTKTKQGKTKTKTNSKTKPKTTKKTTKKSTTKKSADEKNIEKEKKTTKKTSKTIKSTKEETTKKPRKTTTKKKVKEEKVSE